MININGSKHTHLLKISHNSDENKLKISRKGEIL